MADKSASFEFNLQELAGLMGDLGTLFPLAVTVVAALLANMAVGFTVGLAVHYGMEKLLKRARHEQHEQEKG